MCSFAIITFSVFSSYGFGLLTIFDFALSIGHCANTDFVTDYLTDLSLIIRTLIHPYVMDNCVNCNIVTNLCNITGRRPLNEESILNIVRGWVAPRIVESNNHICQACWDMATDALLHHVPHEESPAPCSHVQVCIYCGRSLLRNRSHFLRSNPERERRIQNLICEWILPRSIGAQSKICHPCWMRADRAARHCVIQPSTSSRTAAQIPNDKL